MTGATTTIEVRRAADRFHTDLGWLDSRHNFSFGSHFDPDNTGHGLLIVSNDDRVAPGAGFGTHSHRDMEIVTWVLEGALEHRDSNGNHGVLRPGIAQRMSAGTGIQHAEMNASANEPVHFVQMWVVPDQPGHAPGYQQADVTEQLERGGLVAVAAGPQVDSAITINQPGAVMWVARTRAGERLTLPDARFVHAYVANGAVQLGDDLLSAGDAVQLTSAGDVVVEVVEAGDLIVWESDAEVKR